MEAVGVLAVGIAGGGVGRVVAELVAQPDRIDVHVILAAARLVSVGRIECRKLGEPGIALQMPLPIMPCWSVPEVALYA